jgi:hypothetical protein
VVGGGREKRFLNPAEKKEKRKKKNNIKKI